MKLPLACEHNDINVSSPVSAQVMSELGIGTVGELASTPLPRLEAVFGEKDAQLLAALARGITGGSSASELL